RRRHTRCYRDWSSDVCSSDLFDAAREIWPRGDRPAAIREAAETFRGRFKEQGQIRAIRTVDLVAAAYPTLFAFGGAAKGLNPYRSEERRVGKECRARRGGYS